MKEYCFCTRIDYHINMFIFDYGFPVEYYLISFYRYNFACILVDKIFDPCFQDPCSQFTAHKFLDICLGYLMFLGKVKYLEDFLVAFKTYCAEKCGYRQFLLPVDICVHHIIDVGCKFDPRSFERYYPGRIQFGSVGVDALSEENAGGSVQL